MKSCIFLILLIILKALTLLVVLKIEIDKNPIFILKVNNINKALIY